MPTYIILGTLRTKGYATSKTPRSGRTPFGTLREGGAHVKDTYRTMGRYDLAAL